jgi:hypothetical protein
MQPDANQAFIKAARHLIEGLDAPPFANAEIRSAVATFAQLMITAEEKHLEKLASVPDTFFYDVFEELLAEKGLRRDGRWLFAS